MNLIFSSDPLEDWSEVFASACGVLVILIYNIVTVILVSSAYDAKTVFSVGICVRYENQRRCQYSTQGNSVSEGEVIGFHLTYDSISGYTL